MNIVIKFHDNDFGSTFINLLYFLREAVEERLERHNDRLRLEDQLEQMPKEDILELINSLSYGFYLVYQNYDWQNLHPKDPSRHRLKPEYLKISKDKLLIGQAAVDYAKRTTWDNRESYCLIDNQIFSI